MVEASDWSVVSIAGVGHHLNQDRFATDGTLFCLADGMGGPAGGHVAATIAVRAALAVRPTDAASLAESVAAANRAVREARVRRSSDQDMGTTLTVALVTGSGVLVASVGDTRCYLSDSRGVRQITDDDTVAASMNIEPSDERYAKATATLTRSIGDTIELVADVREVVVDEPSTLLLTTDGVHEFVDRAGLQHAPSVFLDQHTLDLVSRAQQAGSLDDASVVAIAVQP